MALNLNFSLSFVDVQRIFTEEPFGIASFARQVKNELDAFSFAVHSGLLNIRKSPPCGDCQILRYYTKEQTSWTTLAKA